MSHLLGIAIESLVAILLMLTIAYCIVLNLGTQPQRFDLRQATCAQQVVLSTHLDRTGEVVHSVLTLRADEGVILASV